MHRLETALIVAYLQAMNLFKLVPVTHIVKKRTRCNVLEMHQGKCWLNIRNSSAKLRPDRPENELPRQAMERGRDESREASIIAAA